MAYHSKLPGTSEEDLRPPRTYSWWMPILWGMEIAVILSAPVAAVIVLELKGLIPSWVFGWISDDREAQKRQFLRMLYGLFALFFITQLARLGLFGEVASMTL